MFRKLTAATIAASFVVAASAGTARAGDKGNGKTVIKLATLAPKQSPWGKVFDAWAHAVKQKTKNEIEVVWLWNGTAGPEDNVVGKIKSGQITGAAITAVGLASIYEPINALQMPGAFKNWTELDAAREKLKKEFDEKIVAKGFYVSGWGDVGIARSMSRGFAIVHPDDVKGKSPAHLARDKVGPKVYEVIGGVTAKPVNVTEILPMLNSGALNMLTTPSLAAEQLQWSSKLDHINTGVVGFGVGATVLSEKELSSLSPDNRKIMEDTGELATQALTRRIRKEDDEAFARLQKKMTVHKQTDAEREEWQKVYKKACQRLKTSLPDGPHVIGLIGYC